MPSCLHILQRNETPLDQAKQYDNKEAIKVLQEFGSAK